MSKNKVVFHKQDSGPFSLYLQNTVTVVFLANKLITKRSNF